MAPMEEPNRSVDRHRGWTAGENDENHTRGETYHEQWAAYKDENGSKVPGRSEKSKDWVGGQQSDDGGCCQRNPTHRGRSPTRRQVGDAKCRVGICHRAARAPVWLARPPKRGCQRLFEADSRRMRRSESTRNALSGARREVRMRALRRARACVVAEQISIRAQYRTPPHRICCGVAANSITSYSTALNIDFRCFSRNSNPTLIPSPPSRPLQKRSMGSTLYLDA